MRLFLVAFVFVLAACGGGGSSDPAEMTSQCSDVWKIGTTLDLDTYEGCEEDGTILIAVTMGCYDADQKYVGQFSSYQNRLWVVQTGTDKNGRGGTPGKVTDVDPNC